MRTLIFVAASGLGLGLAIAQDHSEANPRDQDCKQMVSGTWTSKPGDGQKAVSVTYQPDGVYRQGDAGGASGEPEETGSWIAQAGDAADACDLTLTPKGGEPRSFTLRMVDSNTAEASDGTVSTRTEGSMEEHTTP